MVEGPTNSIKTWQVFLSHSWQKQKYVLTKIHGGQIIYWQFQEAMDRATKPSTSSHVRWGFRCFFKIRSTLGCKGLFLGYDISFFFMWIMQVNYLW